MITYVVCSGGTPLHTLGLSDEQHPEGSDYQSYIWMGDLFERLGTHLQKQLTRTYRMLPPRYTFTITQTEISETGGDKKYENIRDSNIEEVEERYCSDQVVSKDNPWRSVMVGNRRVTSEDHFQDVRLVEFDVSGSGIKYKPGDVVWIYPRSVVASC